MWSGGGGVGFVSGMPGPSTARLPTASGVQQDGSREEPIQEEDEYAASEGSAAPAGQLTDATFIKRKI